MAITSATFSALDTNMDGYVSADELSSTGETMSQWDTNADGQISRPEWETVLDKRETVSEHEGAPKASGLFGKNGINFASQTQFEANDFTKIDGNGDGFITKDEWNKCNLDVRLFDLIGGSSGSISQGDWNSYMSAQGEKGNTSYVSGGKQ